MRAHGGGRPAEVRCDPCGDGMERPGVREPEPRSPPVRMAANMHRTGAQFRLTCGPQTVVVVGFGGALRQYSRRRAPDRRRFRRRRSDRVAADSSSCRGPTGSETAATGVQGRELQLPVEPDRTRQSAIHGLLRWTSWQAVEQAERRVVLATHALAATRLPLPPGGAGGVRTRPPRHDGHDHRAERRRHPRPVRSRSAPVPLAVAPRTVDGMLLTVPARTWLRTDDCGLPVASEPVARDAHDFGAPRPIGPQRLDTAFTDLRREADRACRRT